MWWVDAVRQRARLVLWLTSIATLVFLGYALNNLGLNMSQSAILSDELPFAKRYKEYAEVFPIVDEAIFVVVDADTPIRAKKAVEALAARLDEQNDLFSSVYVPGGGPFFERNALLYLSIDELEDLTDDLASVQPLLAELSRDGSLRGLATVLEEGIEVARTDPAFSMKLTGVFDSVSRAADAVLRGQPRPISWIEVLLERGLPGDSAQRVILVEPQLDYDRLLPARDAIRAIRRAGDEVARDAESEIRVRVTGNVALNYEEMIVVARQAAFAALGSFILVGAVLFGALGSRRLIAAVLAALLVGLVWTAAFAAWAVGHVNVFSVSFAVLYIGLGVDFGIHLSMRYAELAREGRPQESALRETAASVGTSLALCALTTAIGFYVFLPTEFKAVGELGLIAGTGMPISLFCSLTVLPAVLSLGGATDAGRERVAPRWFTDLLIPLVVRHARAVRIGAVVLFLPALCALPFARFDHNISRLRDPSTESVQTFDELLAASDTSPWTMDLLTGSLEEAVSTAEELRRLEIVERAVTLVDYVPDDQETKREVLADLALFVPEPPPRDAEVPLVPVADQIAALRAMHQALQTPWLLNGDSSRSESARRASLELEQFLARLETLDRKQEALESFEASLVGELPEQMHKIWGALDPETVELGNLPPELARRMLAPDGRARVQILPSQDLGDMDAMARFVGGVQAVYPTATGSAVSILEWARATARSFRQALASAFVAVALVVWLLWRRIGDVVLVLTPLVLAGVLTAAIVVALGLTFNFANVLVLPLLLGIGVDSGIHLVHRYRAVERETPGGQVAQELLETSTAHAVFFSALTTIGSFGSLAFSSHAGLASLGQLLVIGVTLTLACNLIVLPALLARKSAP
jgi:hopanoid biosynthesis associated RND transporter like protein HpnN